MSGSKVKKLDKAEEDKSGLMVRCMKDGGKMIKKMVNVDLYMLMVKFMKENGRTISSMETVKTQNLMELMKEQQRKQKQQIDQQRDQG